MIPFVGGPIEALAIAGFAVAGVVVWLTRRRQYRGPRLVDDGRGIDQTALAAAEREAREAPRDAAITAPGAPAAAPPPLSRNTRSEQRSDRGRSGS